jgi:hypothetical protein
MKEALLLGVVPKHGFPTYQAGLGTSRELHKIYEKSFIALKLFLVYPINQMQGKFLCGVER